MRRCSRVLSVASRPREYPVGRMNARNDTNARKSRL
jgi:hypothetical protein